VEEASRRSIFVEFDNTVSRSSWCCSFVDGNGWFGDEYFDVSSWLSSLGRMATTFRGHDNVVAYSLRNEFRYDTGSREKTRGDLIEDWMKYVPMGVRALNDADPSALIFVGGLSYENDWTFLSDPGNLSPEWISVDEDLVDKIVFESHIYDWSGFGEVTADCGAFLDGVDRNIGWVNDNGRAHVITEIGNDLDSYRAGNDDKLNWYFDCVGKWIVEHKAGFAYWVLGGSYYSRDDFQQSPSYDWFGLLTIDWKEWHNADILAETRNKFVF